jgi:hypothetical protein
MKWYQCADNPQAVSHLYSEVPPLHAVELVQIVLHEDGPRIELRGNLPQFPDAPPARWGLLKYNKVQLRLDFWIVDSIKIEGWTTHNIIDIEIEKNSVGHILLNAKGPGCNVELGCRFFKIAGVSGYATTELEVDL